MCVSSGSFCCVDKFFLEKLLEWCSCHVASFIVKEATVAGSGRQFLILLVVDILVFTIGEIISKKGTHFMSKIVAKERKSRHISSVIPSSQSPRTPLWRPSS